ncbi:hypothetical protein B0H16DRAFT_1721703 [Mycena metata]|uniref:Uncharacterized protein n=1 Tax=Mycena metata TaxID=1033252 RepID=A0AAD7J426_9AGAR|nr:hypothetical protein B0H16DRAFT_1721703 [Mycena metata]
MSLLSTTTFPSRRHSWKSLSDVVTWVHTGKRLRSASAPEPFVSSMVQPSIPSHKFRSPEKSALKRPTSAVHTCESSSSDSTPDSSPVPSHTSSPVEVDLWSACAPSLASEDQDKNIESVSTSPPHIKRSLVTRMMKIQIFAPSSPPAPRRRRASREFPNLPPPPEWDEVSLTIDPNSDDDQLQLFAPITRKVRFMVPTPPHPPPSAELPTRCWDEEPTWSEFMVCLFPTPFLAEAHWLS